MCQAEQERRKQQGWTPAYARFEKVLQDAGAYLENNQFGMAVVAASVDMKGDTEKDRLLTEARSMVVRDYLVQNFKFDDTRVKTIGLGKSEKASEGGKVEVLVYPPGTTTEPTPKPSSDKK